ncbi:motility protein A [Limisalsivibrio acetivorans]|uniref:motility protein A n=1 Tax=Limisalsivibrio acetivorans TaxID=1304888 RepID=UPI0003B5BBE3|nr:MotA/TolQ/ExbB proton channel family protein [Limisalsivibrio acetivorans]
MDLSTIIGFVLAYVLIVVALIIGAGVGVYIDYPSVLIVIGGTLGVVMINFPMAQIASMGKVLSKAFLHKSEDLGELIQQLVGFAVKARRDGILSLESAEDELDDDFLKKGIRLAVDGTEPEVIKTILETELDYMEERHKLGASIFGAMGDFAPAMGMIGTLVGLVAMMQSLNDPSSIGPSMAVALLTTFYGAIIMNMFAGPITGKLKVRSAEEILMREIMIAGIMAIQAGDNPRIVEQKLNAYLSPGKRKSQFD